MVKNMTERNLVGTNKDTEIRVRENLSQTVAKVKEVRRKAEQDGLTAGAGAAEDVLLKNIPTLGFIVDGNLRDNNSHTSTNISTRINSLPVELAEDTLAKTNFLLSLASAVSTTSVSRRLAIFLPMTMPKTRDGLIALRLIADGCRKDGLLQDMNGLKERVVEANRLLGQLDKAVIEGTKNDKKFLQTLSEQAQEIARLKLPELMVDDSGQVAEMRAFLAEEKIRALRQETLQAGGVREHSRYEILCNEIIKRDNLTEQIDEIQQKTSEKLEKAREVALSTLARRRAVKRVLGIVDTDPQFCQVLAGKNRMSSEDLLKADETTKRRIANNALDSRPIVLSMDERKAFNGEVIVREELQQLDLILRDPSLIEAELGDEEKEIVARLTPNTSDRRSIFDIAKDRLKNYYDFVF